LCLLKRAANIINDKKVLISHRKRQDICQKDQKRTLSWMSLKKAAEKSILTGKVINFDETSFRLKKSKKWLRDYFNAMVSLIYVHPKRGKFK
jgi:hypothetical protein